MVAFLLHPHWLDLLLLLPLLGAVLNSQVGSELVSRNAPEFDGYQVVAGTWKPKDMLTAKETKGTNSAVFNVNFYGPGTEVDCELVQFVTVPATQDLAKSQVINEASPSTEKWLVMKADPIGFDEPPLHFQVTLRKSPDLDLTKTTPA